MGMYATESMVMNRTISSQSLSLEPSDYQSNDLENWNYLEHHGIQGQKWGIRRFQNKDGSLTNAGRRRYGDGSSKPRKLSSYEKKIAKLKKQEAKMSEREEIQRRKNQLKERKSNLKNQGKTVENKEKQEEYDRQKERDRKSMKSMTDDELRSAINRLNLEKQYKDLVVGPQTKKGENKTKQILGDVGKVIITSAATAATKQLSKAVEDMFLGRQEQNQNQNKNKEGNKKKNSNTQTSNSNKRRSADTSHESDWNDFAGDVEKFWRRRNQG